MVYVINHNGKALMPTNRHGKVRRLLRDGYAIVVRRTPFTIQLLYDTTEFLQNITLGVDSGTAHIGLSATTSHRELFSSEVLPRTDIVELLSTRREARRNRRNRKTRYRASRYNNRLHSKKNGWIAPSIEQKIKTHLQLIRNVCDILPISEIIIEVAPFDIQSLKNPVIKGKQYQQGEQYGFWNTREYVLFRDKHTCQCCQGKSKDKVLNVHHLVSRKSGGNSPSNLITLCKTCHNAIHRGEIKFKTEKNNESFRNATLINIMRWELVERAKKEWNNVHVTYGYITKYTRIRCNLEKSHRVDARCISKHPMVKPADVWYYQRQVRRHNRQIYKANTLKGGLRKKNQASWIVKGFRLFDKVKYNNIECFIFGRRQRGSFCIKTIEGFVLGTDVSYKKLEFCETRNTYLITAKRDKSLSPAI